MAYLAILILLALLSSLAFAFLFKVGTQTRATVNRASGMQAEYLAESAVNHAIWRLLNDPTFNPANDTYSMHSFADGRYGYKVRKPTETTFATIATVGAFKDSVAHQSYVPYILPSNILCAYGRTTTQNPPYRRLIGALWTDELDIAAGSTPSINWVEMAGCPVRKEILLGVLDSNNDITSVVWDGAEWGTSNVFTLTADSSSRSFDIAYESQSGKALIVGRFDATTGVRYNTYDGTNWQFANPQPAFNLDSGALSLVTMASCPGNNDILIATVSWNNEMKLFHWNGSAFTDLGMQEASMDTDLPGGVEIVYERQSGDALIIWHASGDMRYQVWNGTSLATPAVIPGFASDVKRLRVAEDPTSDFIVVIGVDKFYDLTVAVWDGDAWIDAREIYTDCADYNGQILDVAWETSGQQALIAFGDWAQSRVRYFAWEKGTALADNALQVGPNHTWPWRVRLFPMAGTDKIILLTGNTSDDLKYSLWNGDVFKGHPGIVLETDLTARNQLAFALAEANVPITGGTGTGGTGNTAPVVDAGTDQTLTLPVNQADLDGTVTDDGLPNPPATVNTTWSVVSGPGTVTFDDANLVDTIARFSDPGTYVLRLTADDSALNAFDDVTVTVLESCALLLVVADATSLSSDETDRKTTLESWGWTVSVISDHALQSDFDAAVAANDVAYVPVSVDGTILGTKLRGAVIGVVIEELMVGFGTLKGWNTKTRFEVDILDNAHYITAPFNLGLLTFLSSTQLVGLNTQTPAPGAINLAQTFNTGSLWDPSLTVYDTGGELYDGIFAAARRVQLPWGDNTFDFSALNASGKTIMQRAVEWAAEKEGGCGGGDPLCAGLIGYWELDETSGTVANDASANGYNGTLTNMDPATDWVPGHLDGALDFDGVDDHIDLSVMNPRNYDDFSISVWYRSTDTSVSDDEYIFYHNFNFEDELVFGPTDDQPDRLRFGLNINGSWNAYYGTSDIVDQLWHHLVAVRGGGRIKLYVDGLEEANVPDNDAGQTVSIDGDGPFIGDYPGVTEQVHGSLDDLRIYDRALDPTEVASLYNLTEGGCGGGGSGDTDPPTPDPMTWASPPAAAGPFSITMTATTASDPSGVYYYFECTAGGCNDSGWQDSPIYVDTGLSASSTYTYRVKAIDKATPPNETGWSTEESATTTSNEIFVHNIAMGFRTQGVFYFAQATVWIKGVGGADMEGAIVSGTWSGDVSGTSMGSTGSNGQIMLESPSKKNGGTYNFAVTNVTKAGYVYNPALNMETTDWIVLP